MWLPATSRFESGITCHLFNSVVLHNILTELSSLSDACLSLQARLRRWAASTSSSWTRSTAWRATRTAGGYRWADGTFTSSAFSGRFYWKPLTISTFVIRKGKKRYCRRYSKDVHGTKCRAPTITRLTHSPLTTKIARTRSYTTRCYH